MRFLLLFCLLLVGQCFCLAQGEDWIRQPGPKGMLLWKHHYDRCDEVTFHREEAVRLLSKRSFLPLTQKQVQFYLGSNKGIVASTRYKGLHPYLVRAVYITVCENDFSLYIRGKEVWIASASDIGELEPLSKTAAVVWLKYAPSRVYVENSVRTSL